MLKMQTNSPLSRSKVSNTEKKFFSLSLHLFFVSLQRNSKEYEEKSINPFDNSNHLYGGMPAE